MKRIRIAQMTLVFGMTAGLAVSLPGLFWHDRSDPQQQGLILVNGRIEGTEVAVGSKLAGRVVAVNVREGQEVQVGQLIAELEAEDVEALCEQARANVSKATHNLTSSREQVTSAEQQLAKANVVLELARTQITIGVQQAETAVREADAAITQAEALHHKAQTEHQHARQLHKDQAASDLELMFAADSLKAQGAALEMARRKKEQALEALKLARARTSEIKIREHELAVAESAVRRAKAMVGVAEAQLQAAKASLKSCEIQLKDSKIYAPSDGVVVTRAAEPGEVIAAGSCVAVIVDFDNLYLKGYLPNKLIGKLKHGDAARIYLDAFPDRHFDAKITKIHQQAEFTPKHVDTPQQRVTLVFGVELTVSNPERFVKPGIPAEGVIRVNDNAKWLTPADLR